MYDKERYLVDKERFKKESRDYYRRQKEENPTELALGKFKRYLRRKFDITYDIYVKMILDRFGCCDLCGNQGDLEVDHDHSTNEVRGMLCRGCNCGLGMLGDDEDGLFRAISYLRGEL